MAIVNVTVVPMDAPGLLENHTVVLDDGVIQRLGPSWEIDPSGAEIVDGTGRFLTPGLADMHVHYCDWSEFGMFLANGVTLVRNMWGEPRHLAMARKVERGEFPGPRVVTTSPLIDGVGPNGTTIWPLSHAVEARAQAAPLVERFAARGYRQVKTYGWLTLETLAAIGAAGRRVGLPVTGHCPDGVTYEDAIDAGMRCFEHLTGIAEGHLRGGGRLPDVRTRERRVRLEGLRVKVDRTDLDAIRRLAARLAADEIWNCPTLTVHQGMSADHAAAMRDPLLRYEHPVEISGWNPANDPRLRDQARDLSRAWVQTLSRIVGILHEEGAPLLVGTDTPNPFVFQGFSVHEELANLVAAGLTPYEALRCATCEAARFLHEAHLWGTVAPGRQADLLLVRADPLANVAALREPDAVFVNGFHLSRSDLDALLEQRAMSVCAPLEMPQVALEPAPDDNVVREGTLVERFGRIDAGRVCYRHRRVTDGDWLLEERSAGTVTGFGVSDAYRRTTRIWLTPDARLRRSEETTESFLGEETCEIERSDAGTYVVRLAEIDGQRTTVEVLGEMTLASERAAVTAVPLALAIEAVGAQEEVPMLSVDLGEPRVLRARFSPDEEAANGHRVWRLEIVRPGERTEQSYHLSEDGSFLGMAEGVPMGMGLRELAPVPEGAPAPAADENGVSATAR